LASDASAEDAVGQLLDSGLWKSLDAVKNNRVYRIDFDQFLFNDPIFAMKQVDLLADVLTRKQ